MVTGSALSGPCLQPEDDGEPEMDVRGGGQAADDKRIVKDEDYASGKDNLRVADSWWNGRLLDYG